MAPFALTEIEWDPYDKRIFLYRKQLAWMSHEPLWCWI